MIIAFSNDQTAQILRTEAEAITYCEGIDVAAGVYIFTDEQGEVLEPEFTTPNKISRFPLGIKSMSSGSFVRHPSGRFRKDLIDALARKDVILDEPPR